MQAILVVLLAATGAGGTDNSSTAAQNSSQAVSAAPRDGKPLVQAVAAALKSASSAKGAQRASVVEELTSLFNELDQSSELPSAQKRRLGVEVRARLIRYQNEFRSDIARSEKQSVRSAAGGPATEGLSDLVDLIQKTIGPDDWILAQQRAPQAGAAVGFGGRQAQAGQGNSFQEMTNANGQALADLIQDTVAPDSWDIRGGAGHIVYFVQLHALVIRQTGDVHDDLGDLLGALRK